MVAGKVYYYSKKCFQIAKSSTTHKKNQERKPFIIENKWFFRVPHVLLRTVKKKF